MFGKLLSKFFPNNKSNPINIPQSWEVFTRVMDEKMAIIRTNVALMDKIPISEYGYRINIVIKSQHLTENGLPNQEENHLLGILEDELFEKIQSSNIIATSVMKWDNKTYFFIYSKESQLEQSVIELLNSRIETERLKIVVEEDKDWMGYKDLLYPNVYDRRIMENNKVKQVLMENGDDFSKQRNIEHWCYFKTQEDTATFLEKIDQERYTVFSNDKIDEGAYLYQVGLSHMECIDNIDTVTLELLQLAEVSGGSYDGWGCHITK
ncbi:MAG: DUF695 domain-containing protein [Aerococcaceae bacterium]|nr:DUF695 domain-containing protein [Aerococcaceae bacterium]